MSENNTHPNLLFTAADIDAIRQKIDRWPWARTLYERLKSAGVRFISAIQESSTGEKFCYFYDPDGAILEIIEPPEGPLKSATE